MNDNAKLVIAREVSTVRKDLLKKLDALTLDNLLGKLNPYLQATTSCNLTIVLKRALDAHILSSQESVFGKCLENIAKDVGDCLKSSTTGVDLDFKRNNRILMAVKSGENWSNSSSAKTQSKNLKTAKRVVSQNGDTPITIVGCCYGRRKTSARSELADLTISGQNLWYLLSRDKDFYKKIIHEMNQGAEEFERKLEAKRAEIYSRLLSEIQKMCPNESNIWDILVERCCKNFSEDDKLLHGIMGEYNDL